MAETEADAMSPTLACEVNQYPRVAARFTRAAAILNVVYLSSVCVVYNKLCGT